MAVLQTKDTTHIVNLGGVYLVCDVCDELQIALGLQGDVTLVIAWMIQSSTYKPRKRLKAMSLVKGLFGVAQLKGNKANLGAKHWICSLYMYCIDIFSPKLYV